MGAPDVLAKKTYSDNITLLAQQMTSTLRPTVMIDSNFKGLAKFVDQYGAADDLVELSGRYQDTPVQSGDHQRRMLTPRYFVGNTLEDPTDALAMITDPKGAYLQAKKAAAERKIDDLIIGALGGTAYKGVGGATPVTFPATQLLAGVANTGMTKGYCISAMRNLNHNQVEKSDRFMAHTAAQLQDLLLTTDVTSSDFNIVKPLYEGELKTWLGFNWVPCERLTLDATSTYRECFAYQKKGVVLGIQKEIESRLDERKDKNYAWQIYLKMCMNATRLEEVRVVKIQCVELAA